MAQYSNKIQYFCLHLRIVRNKVTSFYFCIQQITLYLIHSYRKKKPLPLNNNVPILLVIIYNLIWLKLIHKKIQPFRRFSKFPLVIRPVTWSRKYTYHLLSHWTLQFAHRVYLIAVNASHNKKKFLISGLNKSRAPGNLDDKNFMVCI